MHTETAFQRLRRTLEQFSADVERTRAGQAVSEEQIASVEYELDQLKKLISENALPERPAALTE